MRHKVKKGRRFGRKKDVRKAFLRSLAVSLIANEKIKTTESRAKELRQVIEPFVTKAKKGTVTARRELARDLPPAAVKKLVEDIAPRYSSRSGGYTRITKLGRRADDAAPMTQIEFVK